MAGAVEKASRLARVGMARHTSGGGDGVRPSWLRFSYIKATMGDGQLVDYGMGRHTKMRGGWLMAVNDDEGGGDMVRHIRRGDEVRPILETVDGVRPIVETVDGVMPIVETVDRVRPIVGDTVLELRLQAVL
jgi:hypothetical protein